MSSATTNLFDFNAPAPTVPTAVGSQNQAPPVSVAQTQPTTTTPNPSTEVADILLSGGQLLAVG